MSTSPASQTPAPPSTVSRRSVARGLAWATPAVAVATAAPAFAASTPGPPVSGVVCGLFYGGGTVNTQKHDIKLGIASSGSTIPAGTIVTWTITMTGGSGTINSAPVPNYSATALYSLTVKSDTVATTGTFTATMEILRPITVPASGVYCDPNLVWAGNLNSPNNIKPGAQVTISSTTTGTEVTGVDSGLVYKVAKRFPSDVNSSERTPHTYISKSGEQTCYPSINYSRIISRDGYDNVTCYPDNTCTPKPGTVAGGYYLQPAKCPPLPSGN